MKRRRNESPTRHKSSKPRIVHFDQIKSDPYPIGEIQMYRNYSDQDIIIQEATAGEPMEIDNNPQIISQPQNSSQQATPPQEPHTISKRQAKRIRRKQNFKLRNTLQKQQKENAPQVQPKQPYITQSGRQVRPPKRYSQY